MARKQERVWMAFPYRLVLVAGEGVEPSRQTFTNIAGYQAQGTIGW